MVLSFGPGLPKEQGLMLQVSSPGKQNGYSKLYLYQF